MTTPLSPPTLEDAIALAARAHRGQVYPSPRGEPFILHPLGVMLRVEGAIDQIVAVLHDLVEDTACSLDDVRHLGYPDEVVTALDRLTHREADTYDAYIQRVAGDAIARVHGDVELTHLRQFALTHLFQVARSWRAPSSLVDADRGLCHPV